MSLSASGSFANQITALKSHFGANVRKKVTPHDPLTQPQRRQRAKIGFLKAAWRNVKLTWQADWEPMALKQNITPFNAYVRHNLAIWTKDQGPVISPNWFNVGGPDDYLQGARGGPGQIQLSSFDMAGNSFAICQYLRNDGTDPVGNDDELYWVNDNAWTNDNSQWLTITRLSPGTWRVLTVGYSTNGERGFPELWGSDLTVT
jgi:hypothetical protein